MNTRSRIPTMTYALAMAAGRDAGNRSMRKAGRASWNETDFDASVTEFNRLMGINA